MDFGKATLCCLLQAAILAGGCAQGVDSVPLDDKTVEEAPVDSSRAARDDDEGKQSSDESEDDSQDNSQDKDSGKDRTKDPVDADDVDDEVDEDAKDAKKPSADGAQDDSAAEAEDKSDEGDSGDGSMMTAPGREIGDDGKTSPGEGASPVQDDSQLAAQGDNAELDGRGPDLDGSADTAPSEPDVAPVDAGAADDATDPPGDGTGETEELPAGEATKGEGGDAGAGLPVGGMDGVADPPPALPPCIADPTQVVVVGDSWIDWPSHTFPTDLRRFAGKDFRYYAVGGAAMATGGTAATIPEQFELAVAQNPDIKVLIMDGGASDIMVPALTWVGGDQCKNVENAPDLRVCRDIVETALDNATEMLDDAQQLGVEDVIYFFYPNVPEGTLLGGLKPNAMLDYALPLVRARCEQRQQRTGGAMRCHFVDLGPVFAGRPELFVPTDVHPNSDGSAAVAEALWTRMVEDCVAQSAGSNCCYDQ